MNYEFFSSSFIVHRSYFLTFRLYKLSYFLTYKIE
jgi:hypothetical protein